MQLAPLSKLEPVQHRTACPFPLLRQAFLIIFRQALFLIFSRWPFPVFGNTLSVVCHRADSTFVVLRGDLARLYQRCTWFLPLPTRHPSTCQSAPRRPLPVNQQLPQHPHLHLGCRCHQHDVLHLGWLPRSISYSAFSEDPHQLDQSRQALLIEG